VSPFFEALTATAIGAAVGSVFGAAVAWGAPLLVTAWKNRYLGPKLEQQQYLLSQGEWLRDRAEKLMILERELGYRPSLDKFQLSVLVARLDRQDQDWAKKIADVTELRKAAASKAAECEENAAECVRMSEWINTHSFLR
jgi:hypothetical protein